MQPSREFDLVVYGATGFTGALVAEYLATRVRNGLSLRWALAGRNLEKLAHVRDSVGAPADLPLIAADGEDISSLSLMAARTRVVLTTVGPYQIYGSGLVAACATRATDYVDLCGEPVWMHQMIDTYHAKARDTGARIVFSCGFDSIPFDLGVWLLQEAAIARFGAPCPRVKGRVRGMKGGFSGGTAASLKATLVAAAQSPQLLDILRNPFALTPGFTGPKQPSGMKVDYDDAIGSWAAPFIMAAINTRNVHRTNYLLRHRWGQDFIYDEMLLTGPGDAGKARADAIAADKSMSSDKGPKPGEGPSKADREAGYFDVLFLGSMADGRTLKSAVKGTMDPGYGTTSKMIAESALSLIQDNLPAQGGIFTPGALMAEPLAARLRAHAGMSLALE